MKPRPRKPTTLVIEPITPSARSFSSFHRGSDPDASFYDPDDKTTVARPPTVTMIRHRGARLYLRLRPVLVALGALILVVVSFMAGTALTRLLDGWGGPEAAPVEALAAAPALPESPPEGPGPGGSPPASAAAVFAAEQPPEAAPGSERESPSGGAPPDPEPTSSAAGPAPPLPSDPGSEQAADPGTDPAPDPGADPTLGADPPAEAPPPVVDTILLSVTVWPENAKVRVDGHLMPSSTFVARFPRNPDTHHLRVVAPGYESKERFVTFSDNVVLDLSLSPLSAVGGGRERNVRRPPAVPARRLGPPTGRPSSPGLDPEPGRRRIEARDPYADDHR